MNIRARAVINLWKICLVLLLLPTLAWADITTNLLHHWKFNETSGTNVPDSAGTNPGTLVGSPTWGAGKLGNAITLNGTTQYMTMTHITQPAAFTIAGWVNLTTTTEFKAIFGWGQGGGNGQSAFLRIDDTDGFLTYAEWDGTTFSSVTGSILLTNGACRHVAVTYSGTTATLYVDGASNGSGTINLSPTLTNTHIGCLGHTATPCNSQFFAGSLDEVRVYSRALTAGDITELFNETVGTVGRRRNIVY